LQPESRVHERYLRHSKKFPNIWCAGCGNGIVLGAIVRAVDELGLNKNEVAMVSGIGCSGRMPVYVDFNTMHTTHGRALAFATGLKMVRPEMRILVVMGDGDALAIGGNHFIHAARRNIGLTAIVINNQIYGMTGGQYSPTTPTDALATTAPFGHIEQPVPITELAQAAGAAYVARSTIYHVRELQRCLAQAISKDGFSVVEAVSYCHTTFGRQNKLGRATDMMRYIQQHAVTQSTASEMSAEQLKKAIVRGVMVDRDIPEYTQLYDQVIAKATAAADVAVEEAAQTMGEESSGPREPRHSATLPSHRLEIRLAGMGGQGMILGGVLLADAAIRDGKNAVQTQSYGPEARGGASRSEVILSSDEIDYPEVIQADILLCMSQEACDKYSRGLKRNGLLIVDAAHVRRTPTTRAVQVPLTVWAREATEREITANVVALGFLVGLTEIVSRSALEEAVLARAPAGTGELNLQALGRGFAEADAFRRG
jgi:2-oxoglutarate ferredoxin oxidoreductase subunit beta